jgi:hypothetical protein
MTPTPERGQVVSINRPGRQFHGAKARFLNTGTNDFVWVSLHKTKFMQEPPELKNYEKIEHANHKLFPASHIKP